MAEQSILTVISRQSKTKGRTDDENRSSCKGHKKENSNGSSSTELEWEPGSKKRFSMSSSWSSIREHCPCYWNRNWRSYWWDSRTDFWEIWRKKDSKWFTITPLRAPLRRPVRDFPPEPQNHTPYPLKTAQNGADDFWGRESLCSRLPGVRFQCDPILNCQKTKIWLSRKRWTGRQFIAESWSVGGVSGRSPDQGIKGDEIPLQGRR